MDFHKIEAMAEKKKNWYLLSEEPNDSALCRSKRVEINYIRLLNGWIP